MNVTIPEEEWQNIQTLTERIKHRCWDQESDIIDYVDVPFGVGPIVDCIYPTVNPYEQQPIHPIAWVVGFFVGSSEWIHSAVSIKTEVK